ncbi:MAG: LysM peptidoglycan-binding domain-containing protein, partial [Anaerolineae bacterium]|nr:LysM peptidoglycan-binding domain-containing protein [Anaerolineae bacterium]
GTTVHQLVTANHLRNPNLIYVGQRLIIPHEGTPTPSPTATPGPTTEVGYHVHPGDNLYRIAQGHGVSVSEIVRRNHIANRNVIYVGQELHIPSAHPGIILTTPTDGQAVGNPITVTGRSDTFEGNVIVDVLDYRFRRVGTAITMGGSMGAYAPFSTTVAYRGVSRAQWGYVEAYTRSPKDGSKQDATTVRVRLNAATGTPPAAGRYHVVRWGETLYSIARRYGMTVSQIAAANAIRNVNRIYAGQRLIIP